MKLLIGGGFPNSISVPKAIGNSGEIYVESNPPFKKNLAELNTSTNLFREWTIPFEDFESRIGAAVVDSSGNVFFADDSGNTGFYRFVPSTVLFTNWSGILACDKLENTNDGKLRFGCTSRAGTIS